MSFDRKLNTIPFFIFCFIWFYAFSDSRSQVKWKHVSCNLWKVSSGNWMWGSLHVKIPKLKFTWVLFVFSVLMIRNKFLLLFGGIRCFLENFVLWCLEYTLIHSYLNWFCLLPSNLASVGFVIFTCEIWIWCLTLISRIRIHVHLWSCNYKLSFLLLFFDPYSLVYGGEYPINSAKTPNEL